MEDMQPGQVYAPQNSSEPKPPGDGAPAPERPAEQPEPAPGPGPAAEPVAAAPLPAEPIAVPASPVQVDTDAADWQFTQDSDSEPGTDKPALPDDIQWTASEFIAHEKTVGWYGALAVSAIVAAALVYLLVRDKLTTGIVLFAAIAFGVFAARKPRTQQYSLAVEGLQIGAKVYSFQDFKTFSVAEEGAIASIVFMPLKRFMPPLTIYVAPDMEDQVIDFLSAYLPFEQHKTDAIDSLLRRIHF